VNEAVDPVVAFIAAACIPIDDSHASGTLDLANKILASHPQIATANIHIAAILGHDREVRRFIELDARNATAKGGPHHWDALTHLSFSKYLRLDPARSAGFVSAAQALLDAGASPNTGFYSDAHLPTPTFESVIYGAAGVAHNPELTRLLLERGADPNDDESPYHSPEWFDNRAMEVLVESGKLTPLSMMTLLLRKLDWTDYDAVAWLLGRGANPNASSHWGNPALHHALVRDNAFRFFELLLDHGADPSLLGKDRVSAVAFAARMGRADVLDLFERRGHAVALKGDDAFLEAGARGDDQRARRILDDSPDIVGRLQAEHPDLLANFAGAGNTSGVRLMLDLGFGVDSRTDHPAARGATALHLAVWRERKSTVDLLIERGAPLEATVHGETPLSLAVKAMVEMSEWTPHESTQIVETLLAAGARVDSVKQFPSGSTEADELLRRYGKMAE
jgi:ankyrin repeat protein